MKSIIEPDYSRCFLCGRNRHAGLQEHHIFGAANRKLSEADGLKVALCVDCHIEAHKGGATADYLHYVGKQAFLKTGRTQQEFLERYGRLYGRKTDVREDNSSE